MKKIEITDLLVTGRFILGLEVGLSKSNIEKVLNIKLSRADIDTPDISYYYVDVVKGFVLTMLFDKKDICVVMKLDFEENRKLNFKVKIGKKFQELNGKTPYEDLLEILSKLNIDWKFDGRRIFLKNICMKLTNGLRIYFAFGNKSENDYGPISITSVIENTDFTYL